MDALVHRIEALPGDGRFALAFRRADGAEQTAVAQVSGSTVTVAESSLPVGWTLGSDPFDAVARAVLALHESRRPVGAGVTLRDVDGGWDVGLGNVVPDAQGLPECTAHGTMTAENDVWLCAECGARAALG